MEDKQTFITHLEKLIQVNHIGEAIESTLDFLDLRSETYLRDTAMKLSGRWGVMNEAIKDRLIDKVTETKYVEEIRKNLIHLKKLINQGIQEEQQSTSSLPTLPKLPQPDFNQLLFDHSLRPAFTKKLAQMLFLQHTSVNIYGEDGTGKKRVLEDLLKALRLAGFEDYVPITIDFKNHAYRYAGMLQELHHQMGGKNTMFSGFKDFFQEIEQQNRWYLLSLYHFDAILDNPKIDPYYDAQFFDDLNSLKNKRNVALVVSTQRPHRGSCLFVEGKLYSNSWLNLKMEPILPLTDTQVKLELSKRLSDHYFEWLYNHPNERQQIEHKIHETPHTYEMLVFLAEQLNAKADEEIKFDERLNQWQKKYNEKSSSQKISKGQSKESSSLQLLKKSFSPLINLFKGKNK